MRTRLTAPSLRRPLGTETLLLPENFAIPFFFPPQFEFFFYRISKIRVWLTGAFARGKGIAILHALLASPPPLSLPSFPPLLKRWMPEWFRGKLTRYGRNLAFGRFFLFFLLPLSFPLQLLSFLNELLAGKNYNNGYWCVSLSPSS